MALSLAQKHKILRLLCYPSTTLDDTTVNYRKTIVDRLNSVGTEGQVEVEQVLTWVGTAEAQLNNQSSTTGIKAVGEIHFFEHAHEATKSKLSSYKKDLSALLDIPSRCGGSIMGNVCV